MSKVLPSLSALLVSAAILLAGSGLQGTLVAIRATIEGFDLAVVGLMMSGYYCGFIVGCLISPYFVRRVGHIRCFAAMCAMASAAALIYPLVIDPIVWFALRLATGFCFAGLYMIIESWINERADNENRGRVLSVYRMVDLSAITAGQLLVTVLPPTRFELFSLIAILTALAIIPVSLIKSIDPSPLVRTKLDLSKLLRLSPLAAAGVTTSGLANGAIWALGPVYVQGLGYSLNAVAAFMSVFVIGGFVGQWPINLLSDSFDRRKVILCAAGFAFLSGFIPMGLASEGLVGLLVGIIGFGFFSLTLFGLSAAHANDHAEPEEFVSVSGGLLLLFGLGSALGPLAASAFVDALGLEYLLSYTQLIFSLFIVFGISRLLFAEGVPEQDQRTYAPFIKTSPQVMELSPNPDDEGPEQDQ
ncbi:MAG: MFS transporter [Pseudomonadota bacterium]